MSTVTIYYTSEAYEDHGGYEMSNVSSHGFSGGNFYVTRKSALTGKDITEYFPMRSLRRIAVGN